MSDALVWQIVRNNNAFLRTQRGINKRFSTERFNLKKINSPRYSGLANKQAIDVSAAPSGKGVVVSTKNTRGGQPAKSVTSATITKTPIASTRNIARNSGFKKFSKLAQRRAAAIVRSQLVKAPKTEA